jgi:SAM-dependent MidA family methyltransferase
MKGTLSGIVPDPFPAPDSAALAVSDALVERIHDEIDAGGGWISFERYMQFALYEPGLGYYSAGSARLGPSGDFTTAPEQGTWLARALAPVVGEALMQLGSPSLVEIGAGTGKLALDLMAELDRSGLGNVEYSILETSADLRERQMARLGSSRVRWLDGLPENFRGIVIANEVADALPVVRFVRQDGEIRPLGVARRDAGLEIAPGPVDPAVTVAVTRLESLLGRTLPEGYRSELCLLLRPWLTGVLDSVSKGGMLLIDYGMSRRDYYRPERADGTLMCHFRQRAHADPLRWPGLQDLTAWVDFSAVADVAAEAGFAVSGFTTQGQFLLESLAADPDAARDMSAAEASQLKTLVLPGEMGERFKLIWLTKGIEARPLPGRDFRNWL